MKTLILTLICLFTLNVNANAQSYECTDIVHQNFNIVITEDSYNLVIDSFIIVTKIDTIIVDSLYTKYIPKSNFKDTLTITKDYISFTNSRTITSFQIIRQLEPWEEQILFNKRLIQLNLD